MSMILAVVVLFSAVSVPAESAPTEKRYALGARGTLVLQVPAGWTEKLEDMGSLLGPYIQWSGPAGGDFGIEMFAMWSDSDPEMVRRKEWIAGILEGSREAIARRVSEADKELRPLAGPVASGAFYSATLREPRADAGERRHVTNAVVVIGSIALNATISTDTRESPALAQALAMLTGARLATP